MESLLNWLIWLPILGGALVLVVDKKGSNPDMVKWLSLMIASATLILCIPLYTEFNLTTADMQFEYNAVWIKAFNINYHLGVDGISVPLILLTAFTTVLVIGAAWQVIQEKIAQYMASFLVMNGLMIGVFCALDAVLFYVFWEAMLVPMFLIIGMWGGPRRIYATIKFFLYTFFGSVFMLVALLYLYFKAGHSFDILTFHNLPLGITAQMLIFMAFLIAFAVKVPMWPVHTWLPDAHVEAPTGGSVVLAAIMLKMGAYGFLRFSLPIAPGGSAELTWLMIALSLIAVVYIGFVALVQQDLKKLIAYSSISHMGFVTLGFFVGFIIHQGSGQWHGAGLGISGGMVQMISHGFVSGALFLCVGVLYDRMHSRQIADYGGVINTMPVFAAFAVIFAMANVGLPGTSGFVGEFMVVLSAFKANFWYAFFAATTLIIGAAYTLWMIKRVFFGDIKNDNVAALKDISHREFAILAALVVFVIGVGVWPGPLIDIMEPTIQNLVHHIGDPKTGTAVALEGL